MRARFAFDGESAWRWPRKPQAKPDLAKAQQIVDQVCAACHGADGNSPTPANPNLAGQHAAYITAAVEHFKSGVREQRDHGRHGGDADARGHARARRLFFAAEAEASPAKDRELALSGQKLFRGGNAATGLPACAACHSPDGVGIPSRYPRLGGQYADYTLAQLKAFKAGERGMDKDGKDVNGRVMAQVAARLSDSEMQAVVQYTSGLH